MSNTTIKLNQIKSTISRLEVGKCYLIERTSRYEPELHICAAIGSDPTQYTLISLEDGYEWTSPQNSLDELFRLNKNDLLPAKAVRIYVD